MRFPVLFIRVLAVGTIGENLRNTKEVKKFLSSIYALVPELGVSYQWPRTSNSPYFFSLEEFNIRQESPH
jgi:hypothetical protein